MLQLGYFKVKHLFFTFDLHEVSDDLQHVLEEHFSGRKIVDLSSIGKDARLKQQQLILALFGYRHCGEEERSQIEKKPGKPQPFQVNRFLSSVKS